MKKKLVSLILATSMVAAMLVGCGGTTEPVEEAAAPKTEEAAPQTEEEVQEEAVETVEPVTLNLAYMPNYGSLWSIENAIAQGFLEEEGITVN